jgi:uncharacterized damage-inducible protein DinB
MDSKSLLEYSQSVRNRYLDILTTLPWAEVVKSRGASFDSMRNIFLHTLDAEDRMINYVIPGRIKEWVSRSHDEFKDADSIRKRAEDVESRTKTLIGKMSQADLERKVEVPRMNMPPVQVRVEDILVHVALENVHHFGELIALLWQIDVEPPHMGWIGYLQK